MPTYPEDFPKAKTMKALEQQGFRLVREGPNMAMIRENPDGTQTLLTIPNHASIRGSTLRTLCIHAGIDRGEFLKTYEDASVDA